MNQLKIIDYDILIEIFSFSYINNLDKSYFDPLFNYKKQFLHKFVYTIYIS